MRIDVLTLFPELFDPYVRTSIIGRAAAAGLVEIRLWQIRDFAPPPHFKVDDKPFGGGPGMVMCCGPVMECFEHVAATATAPAATILLTPQGRLFEQREAERLSKLSRVILICGHYEGFDDRIRIGLGAEELSIGDYVLSGGEVAAMVVMDAVVRLLEGAVGTAESVQDDSFTTGLLEYPQFTRPREFRGMTVPEVLLSGDHARIERWRREQALERTRQRRPDLLKTENWESHHESHDHESR